jgi:tRNA threonylcarbamoyladenosine biosynthesis protein TsaE
MKHHIKSPEEMLKLGQELAKQHKILLLHWELGAGKTLLTKGFAKGLGVDEWKVQSPTYAYINTYDEKVLHMDMYRIETYEELIEKWIIDQITQYDIVIIEWPKFIDQLPIKAFATIRIEKISEEERMVNVD